MRHEKFVRAANTEIAAPKADFSVSNICSKMLEGIPITESSLCFALNMHCLPVFCTFRMWRPNGLQDRVHWLYFSQRRQHFDGGEKEENCVPLLNVRKVKIKRLQFHSETTDAALSQVSWEYAYLGDFHWTVALFRNAVHSFVTHCNDLKSYLELWPLIIRTYVCTHR